MTIAAWQAGHVYVAGNIVNPTAANGHSYISIVGGTSGNAEPAWSGRWPAVADGVANTWAPYSIVTPATLRAQMNWTNTPNVDPLTGQYTDTILGNYILGHQYGALDNRLQLTHIPWPGVIHQQF